MIALLSCNGLTVTEGSGAATKMLVATLFGIHIFERESINSPWELKHKVLEEFHISAIALDSRTGWLFAGAHGKGGLWISKDEGINWQARDNGISNKHIYTIALQHRGEQTILFAGSEPSALYRSDDMGESWYEPSAISNVPGTENWTFPPPPHIAHVKNISFHPDEPKTLYVCIEQGALLKSIDDGQSWFELKGYCSDDDFLGKDNHRVLVKSSDPNTLYMCGGEGFYKSRDAGETWDHLATRADRVGYPDAMFIDPNDDNTLFMAGPRFPPRSWGEEGGADPTVIKSSDGGHTWRELHQGLPSPVIGNFEGMGLYHWDDKVMLIAGSATGEVYFSEDAGENWTCLTKDLPPISKGGHYRWFLSPERREEIEEQLRQFA